MKIQWLGHASFKIKGTKVIYIDPWKIKADEGGDIILVTHPHFDHFSPKDIQKIQKENSTIIGPIESLHGIKGQIKTLEPGKSLNIENVHVEAFPSYNTNKTFHPKVNKWLSYLFTLDGTRLFHTGDSDVIDDFKEIKTDILLVPVSGHYVMDAEEAAKLTNTIKPKIAIPMHWGDIVGGREDAEKFASLVKCETKILKVGGSFEFS